ncbi:MAG: MerR family transcriptional regulator [Clostridiales bacterium]|nr:MerR family transcriptional regulator [Erysipelotrichaceae bacterium]MBR2749558.1 MerR family transcriptional regulator [Clostridiales bacterium]
MYTIGQVSEMFSLPVSTLRYYDKEGLFPDMERKSGIRQFSEKEVDALRVIECLKASGLEIREIKQFMQWCSEGPSTFEKRRQLFANRKAALEEELAQLNKTMDMLKYKCWYYEQALKNGSEEPILALLPDHLPEEIQKLYDNCHK